MEVELSAQKLNFPLADVEAMKFIIIDTLTVTLI